MTEQIQQPKFIVKYWSSERKHRVSPPLRHAVFYDEEDLIESVRNIIGNYFVFTVGGLYKRKEDFDKMFAEEKLEKEKQEYLKLKDKFER